MVLAALCERSRELSVFPSLGGWLYTTAWHVSLEGPRQIFSMEVRVGDQAWPQDTAALHDMIAALEFGDQAGTLPSPSNARTETKPMAEIACRRVMAGPFHPAVAW